MSRSMLYKMLGRRSRKKIRVRIADLLERCDKYIALELPRDHALLLVLAKNGITVISSKGKHYAILPLNGNILREVEKILEKGLGESI